MELIGEFKDDQYNCDYIDHIRNIARAIVLNERNEIALIHVSGNDIFGYRDYFETPGGGVNKNESLEQAVIREILEEIGYKCTIKNEIGWVKDFYNLIHRENHSYYFLLKVIEKETQHLEEYEKTMFKEIVWVSIEDAISLYKKMPNYGVSKLVKQRELPILNLVKLML
ncbi:MAG: NUDIX domain-containing protein [Bacilli bacterium]